MVQLLDRLVTGRGSTDDIALLRSVGSRILGKSLCALGDFAVYPVASYIEKWGGEFEAHVELGRCPFDGESSIEGIVAPSDAHAHAHVAQAVHA
jgi:NADH-quinone oxidoreductase subunit F